MDDVRSPAVVSTPLTHNIARLFEVRVWSGNRDHPGPQSKGPVVADKNPRQSMAKKSGKSLKEKRADKRAKTDPAPIENALHGKKR